MAKSRAHTTHQTQQQTNNKSTANTHQDNNIHTNCGICGIFDLYIDICTSTTQSYIRIMPFQSADGPLNMLSLIICMSVCMSLPRLDEEGQVSTTYTAAAALVPGPPKKSAQPYLSNIMWSALLCSALLCSALCYPTLPCLTLPCPALP